MNFRISSHKLEDIDDPQFGTGKRLSITGVDSKVEKTQIIEMYEKLYEGEYLGLYDIEYHKPEGYVIKKPGGTMYFAFFDEQPFEKEVELRGLIENMEYEVIEYDTETSKGKVMGDNPVFHITSKPGNNEGEQVFYYVLKCVPSS